MRFKDQGPMEFEHRRARDRGGEPGRRPGPRSEQHRSHGRRGPEGRVGRGGPGGRGRGRGRAQRGDVRTAILLLLADEPMHGYQIMQAMSDRSGGAWHPSPGAIYPTIAQLEDEGLVTTREEGGRRLVTLTAEGRTYLEERSARLGDPFADFAGAPNRPDLREPVHQLHAAVRQIEVGGSEAQLEAAERVLAQARRSLYLILAGEAEDSDQ
ncbi:MAG TPA: PadR family transcriptional regulator [Propionibacteriaceae bacterium]|nr:PadR family transcriptional regulator [Propionibacteriaceae bacterium]